MENIPEKNRSGPEPVKTQYIFSDAPAPVQNPGFGERFYGKGDPAAGFPSYSGTGKTVAHSFWSSGTGSRQIRKVGPVAPEREM